MAVNNHAEACERRVQVGASAGGHLAAAVALCPLPGALAAGRPDALVLLNPVLDLETVRAGPGREV